MSRKYKAGGIVAGFALLAIYFSGQFPPFTNPNELTRLETVYAFVEKGTFAIDEVIPILGDHEDKASVAGRTYSNKAPGLALAAIPVYRALRVFWPAPRTAADNLFVLLRLLVVSSVCIAALVRFLVRLAPHPGATLIGLAVAFGTPYLFYARSFFSHAWAAALLFLAWDLLRRAEEREHSRRVVWTLLSSGAVAMWAAISEYPVAPLAALLALRAFSGRSWKRATLFVSGAALPLALLLAYNAVCFGSPFSLSSAHEASPLYAGLVHQGFFGFGRPNLAVAVRMWASPERGLLLFCPFWLWSIPGFIQWWRSGHDRSDAAFALASCVGFFVLMTAYSNWHGGWSLGNRYLLPVLFLAGLALPHALSSPLSRSAFLAATVFSVVSHFLLTASWPHFPPDFSWPVAAGSEWFLQRGWVAPNLLHRFSVLSLVPPAVVTVAAVVMALRSSTGYFLRPAAVLVGLLIAFSTLWIGREPAYSPRLWRAAIYGAYSGLDPRREELARVVLSARTPFERRQGAAAWRLYGKGELQKPE
ncbi:MAG TPA: hypothetical protein VJA66_18885 [Thermoanaerobaculia bacterium]